MFRVGQSLPSIGKHFTNAFSRKVPLARSHASGFPQIAPPSAATKKLETPLQTKRLIRPDGLGKKSKQRVKKERRRNPPIYFDRVCAGRHARPDVPRFPGRDGKLDIGERLRTIDIRARISSRMKGGGRRNRVTAFVVAAPVPLHPFHDVLVEACYRFRFDNGRWAFLYPAVFLRPDTSQVRQLKRPMKPSREFIRGVCVSKC